MHNQKLNYNCRVFYCWPKMFYFSTGYIFVFLSCCTRTWRSCRTSASMTRLGSSLDSRNRWSTCTTRWVCNKDAEPTEANFFFCSSWSWSFIARPKPSFFFAGVGVELLLPGWNQLLFCQTSVSRLKPTHFWLEPESKFCCGFYSWFLYIKNSMLMFFHWHFLNFKYRYWIR